MHTMNWTLRNDETCCWHTDTSDEELFVACYPDGIEIQTKEGMITVSITDALRLVEILTEGKGLVDSISP